MFDNLSEAEWAVLLALEFNPDYESMFGERALVQRMVERGILSWDLPKENRVYVTTHGLKLFKLHRIVCA